MNGATMQVPRSVRRAPLQFPRGPRADSGAQRSVAGARLDKLTINVSPIGRNERRWIKNKLQSVLHRESRIKRVQLCGRRRISRFQKVGLFIQGAVAHLTNVQSCGSVHACPVCSPKIRQRRALEIDKAVRTHLDNGGCALFATFTMPHDFGDELAHMLVSVANAFRRVIGGRGYLADKKDYLISGTIRASETTFGKAGAHPHLHVIFFCDRQLSPNEIRTLHARLFTRWCSALESVGYRSPLIGLCPVEKVTTRKLGNYVTKLAMTEDSNRKLGMEMTRHDLKAGRRKGRTPFQVLRDFTESGDCADLDLWHEWEKASHGTQSLTWSKGLKARFAVNDKTDEELAAEEVGGELITEFTDEQWNLVKSEPMGCCEVIECAEREGADGVQFWLFCADVRRIKREFCPWMRAAQSVALN